MKRSLISCNIEEYPIPFRGLLQNAPVYDSSCSPEARVIFIDKEAGYYLKSAPLGELQREAEMTRYFHKKGLGAEVLAYLSDDRDWLLTSAVRGEDATAPRYLADPRRLAVTLATLLRELHELAAADCPVKDRMSTYFATAKENYAAGRYDLSYLPPHLSHLSADEAWRQLEKGRQFFRSDTLLHGDYCLPNIMLEDWSLSGFIDLGGGGVGDRHIDLFWGAWTLAFNLGTDAYRRLFFDAYGRDRIDADLLDLVAMAEVFG